MYKGNNTAFSNASKSGIAEWSADVLTTKIKKRITNQGIPCPLSLRKEMGNKTLSFLAYEYEAIRESNVYSTLWDISIE